MNEQIVKAIRGLVGHHGFACKLARALEQPPEPGKLLGANTTPDLCIVVRVGSDGESLEFTVRKV